MQWPVSVPAMPSSKAADSAVERSAVAARALSAGLRRPGTRCGCADRAPHLVTRVNAPPMTPFVPETSSSGVNTLHRSNTGIG